MILRTRQQLRAVRHGLVHHHNCDDLHPVREEESIPLSALNDLNDLISSRLWTSGMEVSQILNVRRLLRQGGVMQDCQTLWKLKGHWYSLYLSEVDDTLENLGSNVEACSKEECRLLALRPQVAIAGSGQARQARSSMTNLKLPQILRNNRGT